jgi:hypothetical protein
MNTRLNSSCELSIDGCSSDVTFSEVLSAKKASLVQEVILVANELLRLALLKPAKRRKHVGLSVGKKAF